MANYGDFSSLLELGVGVGIGLSFFRVPVDLRLRDIDKKLDALLGASSGVERAEAIERVRRLHGIRIRRTLLEKDLSTKIKLSLFWSVGGGFLNLALLVFATYRAEEAAPQVFGFLALAASVGWYLVLYGALEFMAFREVKPLQDEVRGEIAPE